jgi:hypothetical protein
MPISNPGALIRNHKLRGEWAELRFMARAAEHGLMVSRPWGDSAPYDVMVERDGHIHRVQIKSTISQVHNRYRCHVPVPRKSDSKRGAGAPARVLLKESASAPITNSKMKPNRPIPLHAQIDFLAAYLIPLDLWYILPAPIVACLTEHISLTPHNPKHKYARYQEAWHLLLG